MINNTNSGRNDGSHRKMINIKSIIKLLLN